MMSSRSTYVQLNPETARVNTKVEVTLFKKTKEVSLTVLCLADFVSDVVASQANAHSTHPQIKRLGYLGAALLFVSVVVNLSIVWNLLRWEFATVWQKLKQKAPLMSMAFHLMAVTNPEVLSSFFVFQLDGSVEDAQILLAGRSLKKWGLISQLFEDLPQFGLQLASLIIALVDGYPVTWAVVGSIGFTLFMVCFKVVTNLLVPQVEGVARMTLFQDDNVNTLEVVALGGQFQVATLQRAAAAYHRTIALKPSLPNAVHISMQAILAVANLTFAVCAGNMPIGLLSGRAIALGTLAASYFQGVAGALWIIYENQERLWHCLLNLELTAALIAVACVHPASLLQIDPDLPQVASHWSFLLLAPFTRCLIMGCLSAWAIWESNFPVGEDLCILMLVFNVIGALLLLRFAEDTEAEADVEQVPNFEELKQLEEDEKKLQSQVEALLKQLPNCKLRSLSEVFRKFDVEALAASDSRIEAARQINEAFNVTKTLEDMKAAREWIDSSWKLQAEARDMLEAAEAEEACVTFAEKQEAEECSDILEAAASGKVGAVRHFLRADPDAVHHTEPSGDATALHCAASNGRVSVVRLLLEARGEVDAADNTGQTPLHRAAWEGHIEAVKLLIAARARMDVKGEDGKTPLDEARSKRNSKVVKMLEAAAKPAKPAKMENKKWPLRLF